MSDKPDISIEGGKPLGEAFSGYVYSVPVDVADAFFVSNRADIIGTGEKSFLTTMRIPGGFFRERSPIIQDEIISDTKRGVQDKKKAQELFVLIIDDVVQYVAPNLPTSLGWKSPENTIGLDPEVWMPIDFDAFGGNVLYVNLPDKKESNVYQTAAFLTIPIFYSKSITVQMGVYKASNGNYAIDTVDASGVGFRPSSLDVDSFSTFASGVSDASHMMAPRHTEFMTKMSEDTIDLEHSIQLLNSLMEDPETKLTARVLKKVSNHLELIRKGKDVPSGSPSSVTSMFDLFDLFLFYSHQGNVKASTRISTDRKTFTHFHEIYAFDEFNHINLFDFLKVS